MTIIVNQRNDTDCVLASFCMWLGKPYEEVMERAVELGCQPTEVGMWPKDEDRLAESYGMYLGRMPYYGGLKGILSVPSLNFTKSVHAVFIDNYKIYDPQRGREDRRWYGTGGKNSRLPPCMEVTIDLKDEYSSEIFLIHINRLRERYIQADKR